MGRPRRLDVETDIARHLGPVLRQARKRRGLQSQEVAELLGITPQAVSVWETGKIVPVLGNLVRLCRLYRIRLSDLTEVISDAMTPTVKPDDIVQDAFADFDAGKSVRDLVIEYREDLPVVMGWHAKWKASKMEVSGGH